MTWTVTDEYGDDRRRPGLADLMTHGTRMSEVHPHFEGIPYLRWRMLKIQEQCSELSRAFLAQFVNGVPDETARSMGQSVATPRDGYGWRS